MQVLGTSPKGPYIFCVLEAESFGVLDGWSWRCDCTDSCGFPFLLRAFCSNGFGWRAMEHVSWWSWHLVLEKRRCLKPSKRDLAVLFPRIPQVPWICWRIWAARASFWLPVLPDNGVLKVWKGSKWSIKPRPEKKTCVASHLCGQPNVVRCQKGGAEKCKLPLVGSQRAWCISRGCPEYSLTGAMLRRVGTYMFIFYILLHSIFFATAMNPLQKKWPGKCKLHFVRRPHKKNKLG